MAPHNGPPPPNSSNRFDPWNRDQTVAATAIDWILIVLGPILVCSFGVQAYRRGTLEFTRDGWLRFPIAFTLGLGATFSLAELYALQAPRATLTHPVYVTLSYTAVAYLCTHIPLRLSAIFRPVADQKTTILLQIYSLWWLASIFNCSGSFPDIKVLKYSPIFHVTALCTLLITLENLSLTVPNTIELAESDTADSPLTELPRDPTREAQETAVDDVSTTITPPESPSSPSMWLRVFSKVSRRGPIALSESSDDESTLNNPEPTFIRRPTWAVSTVTHHLRRLGSCTRYITLRFVRGPRHGPEKTKRGPMYWLTKTMVPVTLGLQLAILILSALWQSDWRERLSPVDIALIMALTAFLIVLPLTPFTHKFHPTIAAFAFALLLGCATYNLIAFPYTSYAPGKLFFTLRVNLEDGTTRVQISTVPEAFKYIQPVGTNAVECRPDSEQSRDRREAAGQTCEWQGLPLKMDPYPPKWLNVTAKATGPHTGVVTLNGLHTFDHIHFWKHEPGAPYPTQIPDCRGQDDAHRPPPKNDASGWTGNKPWEKPADYDTEGKEDIKDIHGEAAILWTRPDLAKIPDFVAMDAAIPDWIKVATFEWTSYAKVVFWREFKFD